ncbi:N-acetyllactosaminide beta-1,3-N-acetylglucosaminyltransferase 3 [Psammomys obesus]|uniref:N-acetyllactosaminide beta-1,3-N-acetylglucosaminyltransferase 3 n=1 Tax=Psammomys obesus TaxID=48139 RepID=UPI002453551D|nr:N-acetyllactosaminide beta-1,3-N-acetylglucosaminyltransferase 3 [Psammomys obesus]
MRPRLRPPSDLGLALASAALALLLLLTLPSPPVCPAPEEPAEPPGAPAAPPPRARAAPCPANLTAAAHPDFAGLPAHVRDFLLYRHCRDFPVLREPPAAKCAPPVFLLLAIKSSPQNYGRRQVLRATWARERGPRGAPLRRLFLVGSDRDPQQARKLGRLLELEARAHGDILQWDFHDSFFNLTLKQVLFLEWQRARCAAASFVLDGDDDVFAHTDNMVSYLQGRDPDRHLFVGHLIRNVGPVRAPWSKYFVPALLAPEERYPPYCGGGGILLSRATLAALRRAARTVPLFPIDDVFLGMCLQQQGLAPAAHAGVRTAGVAAPGRRGNSFDPCFYRGLLLVHRFLPFEVLLMWDALSRPQLACGRRAQAYWPPGEPGAARPGDDPAAR